MEQQQDKQTTVVTAPEIVCGGCATSITNALGKVDGIGEVNVDIDSKKVTIQHSSAVSRTDIETALDKAGFSAE